MSTTDDLMRKIDENNSLMNRFLRSQEAKGNNSSYYDPGQGGDGRSFFSSLSSGNWKAALDGNIQMWQYSSNMGMSFAGSIVDMRTQVMRTTMSMDDWFKTLQNAGVGVSTFGGTTATAGSNFAEMSKKFQIGLVDSQGKVTNVTDDLTLMGYTTRDFNEMLLLTSSSMRGLNLADREQRNILFESAANLGKEMDRLSQLTGVQRKEIQKQFEESQRDARFRSSTSGLSPEARDFANKTQMELSASAKGFGDLFKDVMAGKITENSKIISSQFGELYSAMVAHKEALRTGNSEEIKASADRLERERVAAVIKANENESVLQLIRTNEKYQGTLGDTQNMTFAEYNMLKYYMDQYKVDATKAKEMREEDIKYTQKNIAFKRDEVTGKIEEVKGKDAKLTEIVLLIQRRVQEGLIPLSEGVEAINRGLAGSETAESLRKFVDSKNLPTESGGMMNAIPGWKDFYSKGGFEQLQKGNLEAAKVIAKEAFKEGVNFTSETIKKFWEAGKKDIESIINFVKPRQGGSKDATGSWFENFGQGQLMALHGKEAVVPEGKIQEFIADMTAKMGPDINKLSAQFSAQIPQNIPQTVSSAVSEATNNISANASKVNLDDLFTQLEQLNKTMSANLPAMIDTLDKQLRATKSLSPNVSSR